jgi:hypothetical protein
VSGPRCETRRYAYPFPISVCLGYRPRYVCWTWFERRRTRTGVYYWRLKNRPLGDGIRNGDDKRGWLSPLRSSETLFCRLAMMFLRRGKEPEKRGSGRGGGDSGERTCQNGNCQLPLRYCDQPFDHITMITFDWKLTANFRPPHNPA